MRRLGVSLGPGQPLALARMDMYHNWVVDVAHVFKGFDKGVYVVALLHITIVEA